MPGHQHIYKYMDEDGEYPQNDFRTKIAGNNQSQEVSDIFIGIKYVESQHGYFQ